nr:mechanosensitive ion channel domain-containing protein [cf. Phormidesmis sp. LEGE 11477]
MGEADLQLGLAIALTIGICAIAFKAIPLMSRAVFSQLQVSAAIYKDVVEPNQTLLATVLGLSVADVLIDSLLSNAKLYTLVEIPLSLLVGGLVIWLIFRLARLFFDIYLLNAAVQADRKINSEILILGRVTTVVGGIIIVAIVFGQTHQINVVGLVASLGVGGLAVAFAAQKTLEQVISSIILYIDRPFIVDDYIGLPDGTFGQVESVGLRSTKIRTSGKGTLVVVPNNMLTQVAIENFTDAKKVMSIVYLKFYRAIASDERALIRQVILESTEGIFGIDYRSTNITFVEPDSVSEVTETRAQVTFFILGSGEVSMELRRQLLDAASRNVAQKLKEFGIAFDIEAQRINVDSPITI